MFLMADKKKILITVLIAVIIVLIGIILYAFVIRPGITGFVVQKQTEGYNYCLEMVTQNILTQIQQNGFVQFPVGNQTLILVPAQTQQPEE